MNRCNQLKGLETILVNEYLQEPNYHKAIYQTSKHYIVPAHCLSPIVVDELSSKISIKTISLQQLVSLEYGQSVVIITIFSYLPSVIEMIPQHVTCIQQLQIIKQPLKTIRNPLKASIFNDIKQFQSIQNLIHFNTIKETKKIKNPSLSAIPALKNIQHSLKMNNYHYYLWFYGHMKNLEGAKNDFIAFLKKKVYKQQMKPSIKKLTNSNGQQLRICLQSEPIFEAINNTLRIIHKPQLLYYVRFILTILNRNALKNLEKTVCYFSKMIPSKQFNQLEEKQCVEIMELSEVSFVPLSSTQEDQYIIKFQLTQKNINYGFQSAFIKENNKIYLLPSTIFRVRSIHKNQIHLQLFSQQMTNFNIFSSQDRIKLNFQQCKANRQKIAFLGDLYRLQGLWHEAQTYFKMVEKNFIDYLQVSTQRKIAFPFQFQRYSSRVQQYMAKLYLSLGTIYLNSHQYDKAYEYLKALYDSLDNKSSQQHYQLMRNLSEACKETFHYGRGTTILNDCRIRALQGRNYLWYVKFSLILQQIMHKMKMNTSAILNECLECLKILKKFPFSYEICILQNQISMRQTERIKMKEQQYRMKLQTTLRRSIVMYGRQHPKCLKLLLKISGSLSNRLQIKQAYHDYEHFDGIYVQTIIRLAKDYTEKRQTSQTLKLFHSLLKDRKQVLENNPKEHCQCLEQIGNVYEGLQNNHQAISYYYQALKVAENERLQNQYTRLKAKVNKFLNYIIQPTMIFSNQC